MFYTNLKINSIGTAKNVFNLKVCVFEIICAAASNAHIESLHKING